MRSAVPRWGARKCAKERKNQCPLPTHPATSTSLTAATLSLLHTWLALSYLSVFFPSGFVFL